MTIEAVDSSSKPKDSAPTDNTGRDLVPALHDPTSPHEMSPFGLSAQIVAPASLVVVGGQSAGRVYGLSRSECLIGRSPNATVIIADRAVSSRHAVVRRRGNGHDLVDLGSTNGTLLNGSRLASNQPVELHPGDLLQVTDVSLVYLAEGMNDIQDVTQALAIAPGQLGGSIGGLGNVPLNPDEVLLQILKLSMPPEEPPKVPLDVQVERAVALLRKVSRFVPLVAAFAGVGALLGVGSVVLVPPNAEATFSITLTPKASNNPIEERGQVAGIEFFSGAEERFLNSALVESTLAKLGFEHPSGDLVESTTKRLDLINLTTVTGYRGSTPATYRGSYKHRSAGEALRFLKAHVENYLESEIKKTLMVIQKQADFLEASVREKETELRNTEGKMRDFQAKYQDSLPQFSDGHVASLEALRQRQADLQGRAQAAGAAAAAARRELGRMAPREQVKLVRATPYQSALTQARVALADAQSKGLGDSHPDVLKIKSQIAQFEDLSAKELAKAPTQTEMAANPEAGALRRELAGKEVEEQGIAAELGQVSGQIARVEKIVQQTPGVAADYAELSRNYDVVSATHKKLLSELESTRMQLNLERATTEKRYEVVSPPQSIPPPMRSTLAKRAGTGGGVGVLLGALLVAMSQLRGWYRGIPQRRAMALVKGTGTTNDSASPANRRLPGASDKI